MPGQKDKADENSPAATSVDGLTVTIPPACSAAMQHICAHLAAKSHPSAALLQARAMLAQNDHYTRNSTTRSTDEIPGAATTVQRNIDENEPDRVDAPVNTAMFLSDVDGDAIMRDGDQHGA
jgi:hypothetical protein